MDSPKEITETKKALWMQETANKLMSEHFERYIAFIKQLIFVATVLLAFLPTLLSGLTPQQYPKSGLLLLSVLLKALLILLVLSVFAGLLTLYLSMLEPVDKANNLPNLIQGYTLPSSKDPSLKGILVRRAPGKSQIFFYRAQIALFLSASIVLIFFLILY